MNINTEPTRPLTDAELIDARCLADELYPIVKDALISNLPLYLEDGPITDEELTDEILTLIEEPIYSDDLNDIYQNKNIVKSIIETHMPYLEYHYGMAGMDDDNEIWHIILILTTYGIDTIPRFLPRLLNDIKMYLQELHDDN
jgi:hypothetical protein